MQVPPEVVSEVAPAGQFLTADSVRATVARAFGGGQCHGKRVLVIVPDGTRSGPIDVAFRALADAVGAEVAALDVLVALGTHQPMSEAAICKRIGIAPEERSGRFARTQLLNHAWDDPSALVQIGTIPADEIDALSGGLFRMDVPVDVNKRVFDYDQVVIIGPVFPHEVVGFSGGNKYFFPGVAGPRLLNFFHWLGAVVTNPRIIGHADTPVRRVVDRAAALIGVEKRCIALVVHGPEAAGVFVGTPESAWRAATPHSAALHITTRERPFHTILSCVPTMYEDLWTGGKGMYKLEPVLADGGEIIIYAPHIKDVSVTHGKTLLEVGYHCRDYFIGQWERFKHHPWGVLAHSTHVRGVGTFVDGVERCRVKVTVASQIPPEVCARINLGYRDPNSLRKEDFANREHEGVLLVPKAGETLFRLSAPPAWATP